MHQVAVLIYEDLHLFEYSCVFELFGSDAEKYGAKRYDLTSFSTEPGTTVRTRGGLTAVVAAGLEATEVASTIIIPGWPIERSPAPELIEALKRAHQRGARLAAICSGAFVLAATGLLDGRRATTHWVYQEACSAVFPKVQFDFSALYVDAGGVVTSAGSAAGIDMMLDLIRKDYGTSVSNARARRMIIAPHREGGQAQFIERPVPPVRGSSIGRALEAMQTRLDQPLRITDLARSAGMSERNFYRRFRDDIGMSPHEFLIRRRVMEAQRLLENNSVELGVVAARSGFGSQEALRHHFRRVVGQSPAQYRRRFADADQAF